MTPCVPVGAVVKVADSAPPSVIDRSGRARPHNMTRAVIRDEWQHRRDSARLLGALVGSDARAGPDGDDQGAWLDQHRSQRVAESVIRTVADTDHFIGDEVLVGLRGRSMPDRRAERIATGS